MDILPGNQLKVWNDQAPINKIKDREALENAYTNFVEPHVNQLIEIDAQSLPSIPVVNSGFYCVSGWLVLTLLYCVWMRWQQKK
jgi:hypothetical protein